ncbi:MAG: response regulator, partial [Rickettsiales bacterium]|nr:response regulator [Rickettsiales bacterium]
AAGQESLLYALRTHQSSRILCQYRMPETPVMVYLTLEPLRRFNNYFVLRAVRDSALPAQKASDKRTPDDTLYRLLEQMPWPIYLAERDGTLLYVNDAFTQALGYAQSDILMEPVKVNDLLVHKPVNKKPEAGIIAFHHRSGYRVMMEYTESTLQTFSGDSMRMGLGHIVTNYALEEQPDHSSTPLSFTTWQQVMHFSPIAIACLDQEGSVVHGNRSFFTLTGKPQGVTGWPLTDVIHGDHAPSLARLLRNSESTERNAPLEIKLVGNQEYLALLHLRHLEDGPYKFVAYLVDVTEHKDLEVKFTQAQKMHAVGQLAGGVPHDFNNLLTAMLGFCDLLLIRHPPGDPSFADIMQIKQNANRAANLVRQLLAFSRKQTLQPEVIDLSEALSELSHLIRRLIGEAIELKVYHGRDVALIKADHNQLEQVIINLAVNARDAMVGGGTLTLRTRMIRIDATHPLPKDAILPSQDEETIPEGDYVCIEIADTGHGIPRNYIQKIFEPIFTTKGPGAGTGLGLATVYGIIKQTGGYLMVASEEGKGTRFLIFLKPHIPETSETTPDTIKEESNHDAADLTGVGTILLVEDEAPVRAFSSRALSNKGYKVLEAESGLIALDVLKEHGDEVDMIITDVMMPGLTGTELVEQIGDTYPDMQVLFISGYAEDMFLGQHSNNPHIHFLPKPFTLKQLAAKVKDVMDQGNGNV